MAKLKKWCCHPIRHDGTKKIGRAPTHPKGKYIVPYYLDNFIKKQYCVPNISTSQADMSTTYVCTSCYEYEMDRFERFKASKGDQELLKSDDQLLTEPLKMQMDFEICDSERQAENELALLHSLQVDKDVVNNVLRILGVEEIADIRQTGVLHNKVKRACELLENKCENLINNVKLNKTSREIEGETGQNGEENKKHESCLLNLSEKEELIDGFKYLYSTSNRMEQVRLLTIAPASWGRQKVQMFFSISDRQARYSRELRSTEGVLATPEDLRGNQVLDPSVIQAVIHFYEQDWISRVSPNKSDVILIKQQPIPKRF
ncbi:unnamed protein product, partial [Adineta ricciae]